MEFTTIFIVIVVIIYLSKNERGKRITNHVGGAVEHLAASADKAAEALERQCDELLQPDTPEEKAELKAKLSKVKTSTKAVVNDYDDAL